MERPVPGEGMPDGWQPEWWQAFESLHGGATYQQTADLLGRSASTISRWVRSWRDKWGEDIFVSPNEARNNLTQESRVKGGEAGGAAIAKFHADNRAQLALGAGIAADHTRDLAMLIMRRFVQSPLAIAEAGPHEVLQLARAFDLFAARADKLSDLGGRYQDPTDNGEFSADVDLSGLEAAVSGTETQELLGAADDIVRRFKLLKGGGDVIDVEESKSG